MKPVLLTKLAPVALLAAIALGPGFNQTSAQAEKPGATPTDDKATQIIQKAIQAMGGERYTSVKTLIGRGNFTDYKDGVSGIPLRFVDYIVYPDKERTEFSGGGQRLIQTNNQERGWIYDGAALTLKDQTAEQLADFRLATRTGIENLLRGGWRTQGAKLTYVGRREAGLARRNETVRLTFPDGFSIDYEFAADTGLPAKILYERKSKKPDGDETDAVREEDRMYKPITTDGVVTLYVIDHFRNGIQTSRLNYESVDFNKPVADTLFAKPASFKAVK
jgi:hypothetical protein